MSRFLKNAAAFCLLQVMISVPVFWSARAHFNQGYLASLNDKLDLLEADGSPRILFVGGSSVAFGIDSARFASILPNRPVNLGLNAMLGLDFGLNLVREHVRAGDLVVLMPEYSNVMWRKASNLRLHRDLIRQCPRGARYLENAWPGTKEFVDRRAIPELASWVQAGVSRLSHNIRDVFVGRVEQLYSRASFNGNGDMVAHHGKPSRGLPDKAPMDLDEKCLSESIKKMNRCIADCRSKGATVVYAFPPIPEPQFETSQDALNRFSDVLAEQLDCPIVTRYEDSVFPLHDFFDRAGHLTESGKQERTRRLIKGLSKRTEIANIATETRTR